jgi:hypothetical protein
MKRKQGLIADVHTVNAWTDRLFGPNAWPGTKSNVPKELDWDLWLGNPYKEYVCVMP